MAIAGSAITAYRCTYRDGELITVQTTVASSICTAQAAAVEALKAGKQAIIAGPDMYAVRTALQAIEVDNATSGN